MLRFRSTLATSGAHRAARSTGYAASIASSRSAGVACSRRAQLGLGFSIALASIGASGIVPSRSMAAAASSQAEQVLKDPKWPTKFPFRPVDFQRYDEQPDTYFYDQPRFVTHIDDYAINALTKFYAASFPKSGTPGTAVLDICSSWVSHYPKGYKADKISGLGMNASELKKNPVLTDWAVKDLNTDPTLPYPDNTFDVITNCVSVDYLNKPLEVFKEMHRVLKPGGTAYMSFSNRCFPTKAISIWTSTGDLDHIWIVGSYFHYSVPDGFTEPACSDISPNPGRTDPMYVVYASKKA